MRSITGMSAPMMWLTGPAFSDLVTWQYDSIWVFVFAGCEQRSDDDMFEIVSSAISRNILASNASMFACTVGQKPSKAKYYLDDTTETRNFGSWWGHGGYPPFSLLEAFIEGAWVRGKLIKVRAFILACEKERERAAKGGTLSSIFQPSKEHPWEAIPTSVWLRGGSGWASGERGVLAARSGRRSEELLRLQGDLDLHIWEEIDPKIYKEVFKRILQNARTSNFGENWTFVQMVLERSGNF
ncbi:hypothetical protein LR48_Vigan10g177100 [Vigna angularis]|uniref:Uncharacterized protein n=1 Tax=Phaseolus angularis TaxID=3914 RepID=A0A0L9VMA8_PHAAN|nr:hypothetical protein LR48_Vigan10g177100 [Vigna angularis]